MRNDRLAIACWVIRVRDGLANGPFGQLLDIVHS
jgi:hypothetical protein